MKLKQTFIFILCFLFLGISIGYHTVKAETQLKIISSKTVLRRGETGIIVIQGKPNTTYKITTTYALNGREFFVTQRRVTDGSGQATFNWVVERGTDLGTRKAVITGGGKSIDLTHTVTQ